MDFDLPLPDDRRRVAVRQWLSAHPSPSGQDLAEAGYVLPHWPRNFPRGSGQFCDVNPIWYYGFLLSPALTVGGGTFAIQRNIVAESERSKSNGPGREGGAGR